MEILLIGAVILIVAALVSAWLMTFARWFPIEGIDGAFLKDYNTLIRAHIDYVLMALFCLGFYAIKVPLAVTACWLVVIGAIANPTIFVIAAFDPQFWDKTGWKIYTALSFTVATIGFLWVGFDIVNYAVS
ncbi:hypothetical protein Q9L42_011905 [Methylomarinum sp. Ch1-1]|uniref:Uncharacterized protein n=1 Tax=Methylomarinum roseum TaxID=3067653 RepID=A0AAU7NQ31_9GAMM|nr:hypothetical protein [Methylomarinum sp. Ch1-1]MDP4520997.1 hypothetical protein [Methylomarinum sp. Ch1-1]